MFSARRRRTRWTRSLSTRVIRACARFYQTVAEQAYWTCGPLGWALRPSTADKRPVKGVSAWSGEIQAVRHAYELGARAGTHLVHDPPTMRLDRFLSRTEGGADLLVQHPGDDEAHHVALACGQRLESRPELRAPATIFVPRAREVQAAIHGIQKRLVIERLGEHFDGAALHRANRRWH